MKNKSKSGFTIIELMIVLAIIAILAAVALPSYTQYVMRSKRADATNALTDISNQQIQYFMDNRTYGTVAQLNLLTSNPQGKGTTDCGVNAISAEGYYCISVTATASTFTLTATPQGSQSDDSECASISLNSTQTKSATGGGKCWGY